MKKEEFQRIRAQIERELAAAENRRASAEAYRRELKRAEAACHHDWGPTTRDDKVTPGYQFQGDPPGTMGIDRQLPCYVPEQREPRWRRECGACGKVEHTTRFVELPVKEPQF